MGHTEFSDAEGILQDLFLPGFKTQVEREMPPLWQMLKPKSDMVSGLDVIFSAQMENPQGHAARSTASQVLPAAVPGKYERVTSRLKRIYAVLEFDSMLLKAAGTPGGKKSFVDYTENEMKGIKNTHIDAMGRQVFGDGNGVLSLCGTTAGSVTVVLASTANMMHFIEGMHVDLVTVADGVAITNGSDRVIQSVDVDNKRVVIDAAGGVVTTDATVGLVRQGSYGAEITGLSSIVSATADIFGITTALSRRWKSYIATSSGAFDIKKVAKAMLECRIRGGAYPDIIVSSPLRQMQYWYQLTGTRTFDVANKPIPVQSLGVGYYALEVTIEGKKATWIGDINCPDSEIYGLRREDIGIQHFGEPSWMKVGDSILLPNIYGASGTPTYKAVMEYYAEMVCFRRNSHFKMEGVTDLSGW
jgi:hypothetical protein